MLIYWFDIVYSWVWDIIQYAFRLEMIKVLLYLFKKNRLYELISSVSSAALEKRLKRSKDCYWIRSKLDKSVKKGKQFRIFANFGASSNISTINCLSQLKFTDHY